jgi:flagellar hook-basal body complex protein FliE
MNTIDVNSLLSQMRTMSARASSPEVAFSSVSGVSGSNSVGGDFGSLLKKSIAAVGESQMQAGRLAAAFERGDQGADLGRTMVAVQKAGLSLGALAEVRNKMVEAYKDVMNMAV